MNEAPCKKCTARTIGCHAKCKWYKEYDTQRKKMNSQLAKERRMDSVFAYSKWDSKRAELAFQSKRRRKYGTTM